MMRMSTLETGRAAVTRVRAANASSGVSATSASGVSATSASGVVSATSASGGPARPGARTSNGPGPGERGGPRKRATTAGFHGHAAIDNDCYINLLENNVR